MSSGAHVDPSSIEGDLHADRSGAVLACAIIFIVSCTAIVGLRFVSSHIGRRTIYLEDWLMLPSWVMMMGLCANTIWSVKDGGVGRHEPWIIENSPQSMKAWAQSLFVTELIYGMLIPTEKTSILLLYIRLFGIRRWFRCTAYGMIAYIWMWGISEFVVALVQCIPVEYQWNKSIDGTCIKQIDYFRWICAPNAIHDVVMLILPVRVVLQLQIPNRQKLALMGVFLIGSIGCVASFIRMYHFFKLNAFSDRTWASIQLMTWTVAEPGLILICACMPSLWPLLRRVPGFALLSKKSGHSSKGLGSSQRGLDGSNWTRHSRRGQPNNFIPLNDVDHRSAGYEIATLAREPSVGQKNGQGN